MPPTPACLVRMMHLHGPEGELTPVEVLGTHDPETDIFSYRTLSRGAQEVVIENASTVGTIRPIGEEVAHE